MILDELYKYYCYNWARACRELKFGTTTIQNWKKRGYIPFRSQQIIEQKTNGILKASWNDAQP